MSEPVDTADLFRRLRVRSEAGGSVMLCEVGDSAGFRNKGWSDAISMQTWPSKKLLVTGYEVKATRRDWLRELDIPEKNAVWQKQCHEWYVVAPKDVVKLQELPLAWGLMVPRGVDGLRIAKRSETNGQDRTTVSLELMAAVFRAASHELIHLEQAGKREIQEEERERVAEELGHLRREAKDWEQRHMELVDALGSRWDNFDKLKKRAAAIRQLENNDDFQALLLGLRKRLERAVALVKGAEESL